jgi:hypothetical protein
MIFLLTLILNLCLVRLHDLKAQSIVHYQVSSNIEEEKGVQYIVSLYKQ